MPPNLIVLDTNVLVSGLLNAHGNPGQILDWIRTRQVRPAYDNRILDEYRSVLSRPRLSIPTLQSEIVLRMIERFGLPVDAPSLNLPPGALPDPDDLPFAEVAIAGQVNALVTGNVRHYTFMHTFQVPVLTPAEFSRQFRQASA